MSLLQKRFGEIASKLIAPRAGQVKSMVYTNSHVILSTPIVLSI
jgi:hypothetical protein